MDLVSVPTTVGADEVDRVGEYLKRQRAAGLSQVSAQTLGDPGRTAAALRRLAHSGQAICDLSAGVYRWRQIMGQALGEAQIGGDHPELVGARQIIAQRRGEAGFARGRPAWRCGAYRKDRRIARGDVDRWRWKREARQVRVRVLPEVLDAQRPVPAHDCAQATGGAELGSECSVRSTAFRLSVQSPAFRLAACATRTQAEA